MKRNILKILSLFIMLLVSIFCVTGKTYAATTSYDLALYFTFSSDMDIDEGFDCIKPFILYQDGNPCTYDYTFNYESLGNDRYQFTGTFPDGTSYSRSTQIQIHDNASGTYVEALMTEPYRQSIYVKNLNSGKTTNDCLMECWQNRFVCIKDPTYNIQDTPTMNIYTHMTTIENAAGTHNMQYYAVIENVNYTPDDNQSDNATNNDTLPPSTDDTGGSNDPSLDEPIIPDDDSSNDSEQGGVTEDDNQETPGGDTNTPSDSNNNDNQSTDEKNPFLNALIIADGLVGIVLLFLIFKTIKSVAVWLKR